MKLTKKALKSNERLCAPFKKMLHSQRKRHSRKCCKRRILRRRLDYFLFKKCGDSQELKLFIQQQYDCSKKFVQDINYWIEKDHDTQEFFIQGFIRLVGIARLSYIKELFKSWEIQLFDSIESCENNISL